MHKKDLHYACVILVVWLLALIQGPFHWDHAKNLHGPLLLLEFVWQAIVHSNFPSDAFSCGALRLMWIEVSHLLWRTKSHLFFIASFVKSLSDSGSPTLHTLYWWLFSWRRGVPWCAQSPTLLDSFESFLGKEHRHFEEDCIPESDNSTCYTWGKVFFLCVSLYDLKNALVLLLHLECNQIAFLIQQKPLNLSGSCKWHSFFFCDKFSVHWFH